jgi:cyclase
MRKWQYWVVLLGCLMAFSAASPADEIQDAVRAGDLARVKALIEKDPQLVSARNPNGQTLLFDAVMSRRLDITEYLISKGADVNTRNNFDITPLHIACRGEGSIDIVRLLAEKGADVNTVAKYLGKPLDLAEESGDSAVIQYLKSKGASLTPLNFETFRLADRLERISFPWGMRNNIVVSSGQEEILIVDSGFSRRAVEALKKTIHSFSPGEVRLVINTHSDWDHIAGNSIAGSPAGIIGFKNLDSEAFRSILSKSSQPLRGRTAQELPAPHSLRFDGEDIKLIPYPGLHSQDDILIYFQKSGVVAMGDLLLSQNCPAVQNVAGYMEFLAKVLDVFPDGTIFVSGHGRDLTIAGLKKYRDDLEAMIVIVKKNFGAGKNAQEMIREDVLKSFKPDYSYLDWLGPDAWIRQVYRSLSSGALK